MKIETPKKPNKESQKWEEHMSKKGAASGGSEAEITPAKKKHAVEPSKGKVEVMKESTKEHAKDAHAGHAHSEKKEAKAEAKKAAVPAKKSKEPKKSLKVIMKKSAQAAQVRGLV